MARQAIHAKPRDEARATTTVATWNESLAACAAVGALREAKYAESDAIVRVELSEYVIAE